MITYILAIVKIIDLIKDNIRILAKVFRNMIGFGFLDLFEALEKRSVQVKRRTRVMFRLYLKEKLAQ